jgi:hypothetical protein
MFASHPPGGRFLRRFLHPAAMQRYRTIIAATFFRSVDQFKQAIETASGDSQIRSYFFW